VLLLTATPAAAHASLVTSEPRTGTVGERAPRTVRLRFSEPVDPAFTRVAVRGTGDFSVKPTSVTQAAGDARDLVVTLPPLAIGAYAVTWTTTTSDGHTATGDVLLGVGHAADLVPHSAADPVGAAQSLRVAALVARIGWYIALAVFVGTLLWHPAATRRMARAWVLLLAATAARVALLIAGLMSAATGASVADVVARLRPTTAGRAWFVLIDAVLLSGVFVRRRNRRVLLVASGVFVVAEACTGHAAVGAHAGVSVLATAAHLGALTVWLGGLAVVVTLRDRDALGAFLRRFSAFALGAFAVLIASGALLAWVQVGGWHGLGVSRYGHTLLVKLALVATVAALGAWHWRTGLRATLRSSARAELVLAVAVIVAASLLATTVPGRDVVRQARFASSSQPTSATQCTSALIETGSCWEQYFAHVTTTRGATPALREIKTLAASDEVVARECHQLTHTVGRTAFDVMGSAQLALGLSTPLCNSGYPHGVVEEAISRLGPDELRRAIPTFCTPLRFRPYSFDQHNCAHGVGHGIATRLKEDVFASAPYCEVLADPWQVQSCYGGVFMQKVIGDINGASTDEHPEDPVWPCDAVPEVQKSACYRIATGRVLRMVRYDWPRAFAICDGVETGHVSDCYESIGRDAAGATLFDPVKMRAICLGAGALGPASCITGAVQTTVDNEHGGKTATALCAALPQRWRSDCRQIRDDALAQL
jgi:copper transport protein